MGLDNIWKFVRYLLRQRIINAHEAKAIMDRIISKRILLNDKDVIENGDGMDNLFKDTEETPF